jgi:hypothetical protein
MFGRREMYVLDEKKRNRSTSGPFKTADGILFTYNNYASTLMTTRSQAVLTLRPATGSVCR